MFPYIYNLTGITDDKVLHFIIGILFFLIFKKIFNTYKSLFIVFAIALLKEIFDLFSDNHFTEALDIAYTIVGPIIIIITLYLYKKVKKHVNGYKSRKKMKNNTKNKMNK